MKGKELLLSAVAVVFIILFFDERDENKKLKKKNEDLQDDKLKLLKENLDSNDNVKPEVKRQIHELAKIIENLLKERYHKEPRFLKVKKITLKHLIDYAKEFKLFNDKMYNAACILHQFRNEESHELAVKDSENMKMLALLGGIEIIVKLKSV